MEASRTSRRATLLSSKTPGAKPFYVPAGVKYDHSSTCASIADHLVSEPYTVFS